MLVLIWGSNYITLAQSEEYTFNLYNQDGESFVPIEGTKFEITDLEGKNVTDVNGNIVGTLENIQGQDHYVLTTDQNGKIGANIPKGSYKAVEILANEAYVLHENKENRTYYFNVETETKTEPEWLNTYNGGMWSYMKSSAYNEDEESICVAGVISEYNKEITTIDNEGIDLDGDGKIDEISNGEDDCLIVSYDKNGQILWSETFGGKYDDRCNKIIKTKDNGYIIVGTISSPIVYLNGKIINDLSKGNYDVKGQDGFILKINRNGKYQWAVRIGGNLDDEITSVIETQEGNIILGGNFKSEKLNFYEYESKYSEKEKLENKGKQNAFIASYTKNGKYIWSQKIVGKGFMELTNIVETKEKIALSLNYKGNIEIQNIKCESYNLESKNSIIIKMSKSGNAEWGFDMYSIPKTVYMQDNHINITGITVTQEDNLIIGMNCSGKIYAKKLNSENQYENIYTNEKNGMCTNVMEMTPDGAFFKNIYDLRGQNPMNSKYSAVNIVDIKTTHDNKIIIGGYYCTNKPIDVNKDGIIDKKIDFQAGVETGRGFFMKITLDGEVEFADYLYRLDRDIPVTGYVTSISEINKEKIVVTGAYKWTSFTTRNFAIKYLENDKIAVTNDKKWSNGLIISENYTREDLEIIIPQTINVNNYKKTYTISTKINNQVNEIESVKHGENSSKEIEIIPEEGYKIRKIMINNEEYKNFKTDENGNLKLPIFKNVTENILVNIEFVKKKTTIEQLPLTGSKSGLIITCISIIFIALGVYLINYATYKKRRRMNKERIKKIISMNLVLMSILSILNFSHISMATISETQNKANINVSNIEKGVTAKLYKIADIEYDYSANQPKEGYKWEDGIQTWIDENMPEYSNPEDFYTKTNNNSEKIKEFYDKVTSEIKNDNISINSYREKTSSGNAEYPLQEDKLTGNITFEDVEMGSYLVIIENGYMVYMPSAVNLIPNYDSETANWELHDQNVVVKATKPSISKNVTDETKTKDNYSTVDEISYTISADVPTYLENSLSKKYIISDKIDQSLILKNDTIKIYGEKSGQEAEITDGYVLSFNTKRHNEENVTFLADFDYNKICNYDHIKIKYQATLVQNSSLVIGKNGNNNYAYLDYSNNPYSKTSIQTQKSQLVTVFTYGVEIKSVDKENSPLAGSEFNITNNQGEILHLKKGEEGEYYLTSSDDKDGVTNLVVNEEGKIYLKGLDEGQYSIKQIKAPNGYQISKDVYKLNLEDKDLDGEIDEEYNVIFINSKGFVLPVTGGNGTIALVGISIVLIGVGVVMIVSISKKKKMLKK